MSSGARSPDALPPDVRPMDALVATVRAWVEAAERAVVLTGAGISTDSGIPDFRGPQGVWTKNPAAEKQATLQNYVADREVRKAAWQSRLESPAWLAEPNAGHRALVELERRGKLQMLITQNVDGLHLKAGTSRSVPWISTRRSRAVPALRCRPSTFWVIRVSSLPRRSSSTSARWPALGAAVHAGCSRRLCHEATRTSRSAT